jgi:ATP-dependent DNA ligase
MPLEGLAVRPPVAPMLGRLQRSIPLGDYLYEPKWDGFRAIVFRDADQIEIQSRHGRPLGRYFPDVVDAVGRLSPSQLVLDGEIVIVRDGRFDFETLMLRTHPAASRVAGLAAASPATFVVFDLLADATGSLMGLAFAERRARLDAAIKASDNIWVTQVTGDAHVAAGWLHEPSSAGTDGVMAKDRAGLYQPGRRSWTKVKLERTADCVVAGIRVFADGAIASLLLGLYDASGMLRHVGVCAAFSDRRRFELSHELAQRVVPLHGHPWEAGFGLERSPIGRLKGAAGRWLPDMPMDWLPIQLLVVEVAFTAVDGLRFRHPAHFRRWRPDRAPESCVLEQLSGWQTR